MSVTSCSFAVWKIPVAIFRSKRITVFGSTSASVIIWAALSRECFPWSSCFNESLSSFITLRATRLSLSFLSLNNKEKPTSCSKVLGLARGIKNFSFFCIFSLTTSTARSITIRFAAYSVINELTTHVTRINKIVPFRTSSFSKRCPSGRIILYPTNTAANVAAACALLNPNINARSTARILYIFWVNQEAIHFPERATTIITKATLSESKCPNNTLILINIPTPIRK